MNRLTCFCVLASSLLIASCGQEQEVRGITDTEILIGSHLDLSGPATAIGIQVRNGSDMAIKEINEAGGVHGRSLRMIVEDNGYDPKKAVLASKKLISRDKVFAMMHVVGTPVVLGGHDHSHGHDDHDHGEAGHTHKQEDLTALRSLLLA